MSIGFSIFNSQGERSDKNALIWYHSIFQCSMLGLTSQNYQSSKSTSTVERKSVILQLIGKKLEWLTTPADIAVDI